MELDKDKGNIPQRDEIPEEYKWDLTKMFRDVEQWKEEIKNIEILLGKISQYQGSLGNDSGTLFSALKERDLLLRKGTNVSTYARMKRDEDNTVSKHQELADIGQSLMTKIQSSISYFEPEIVNIPKEKIDSFMEEYPQLKIYSHYIDDIMRKKPYTLTDKEETLLAMTQEMAQGPYEVFSMLNNADIKFPIINDENGQKVEITHGRYMTLLESRDRRVREEAFKCLLNTYAKYKNTFAANLNANIKNQIFYAKTKKYPSALYAALFSDNIPLSVYDNLIESVNKNLHFLHKYMDIRKKFLKLEDLHLYDLYTPMIEDVDIKVNYEEGKEIILKGLAPLGQEYIKIIKEGFDSRWIDVYENKGKTSGAYSWGSYDSPPYILMNYKDNLNNLFTLAHELGHSIHSYYSHRNQPTVYAGYSIFLAEIASTLNEGLLMDYLLITTKDTKTRAYLLNHYLEQFRTTFFRQTMFAEFEKIIHNMVEEGQPLTAENLSKIYIDLNKKYFGQNVIIDREIEMEWARIPHFYYNFYVYNYATGFASATSLIKQIKEEGADAVERYKILLKAGSSDYPLNILKKAGVDLGSPKPIVDSLEIFKDLLEEIEGYI